MSSNILKADNGVSSGTTGLVYTAGNDGTLQLATTTSGGTATTAITIDNSQNVGVGVTPNTWTITNVLQIGSNATYGGAWYGASTASGGVYLGSNNYYNSVFKYQTANPATYYSQNDAGSGTHRWFISSGTPSANGAITFTNAMTLDASGNLLIGTTTLTGAQGFVYSPTTQQIALGHTNGTASGTNYINFLYGGSTTAGSISQAGTTGINLTLGSNGGIVFNNTNTTASPISTTLNDYEVGTWTPALNATGVTYSAQVGTYTKVGRSVTVQFYLTFTTFTGSGNVVISGFPFTSITAAGGYEEYSIPYFTNITLPTGCTVLGGELSPNSNGIVLYGMGSGVTSYSQLQYGTAFTSSATSKLILATFTYQANF